MSDVYFTAGLWFLSFSCLFVILGFFLKFAKAIIKEIWGIDEFTGLIWKFIDFLSKALFSFGLIFGPAIIVLLFISFYTRIF